jgi:hypothetical protein
LVCGWKQTLVSSLAASVNLEYKKNREEDFDKIKNPPNEYSRKYYEQKLDKNRTKAKKSLINRVKGETE